MARAIRNAIRANRFARIIRSWNPYFYSASGRFARITRISDSRESPDSRESCESIRANHATKGIAQVLLRYPSWKGREVPSQLQSLHLLFKLSAYKMGVSMRLFKLQLLSSFRLPFSISRDIRSLNEHLRAKFGPKWAVKLTKPKTGA